MGTGSIGQWMARLRCCAFANSAAPLLPPVGSLDNLISLPIVTAKAPLYVWVTVSMAVDKYVGTTWSY